MLRNHFSFLFCLAIVGSAHAGVIYSADFESPEYSIGALQGQSGWSSFDGLQSVTGDGRNGTNGLQFLGPEPGVFSNGSQSFVGNFGGDLQSSIDILVGEDFVPSGPSRGFRTGYGFEVSNGSEKTSVSYYLETASNTSGQSFDFLTLFVDDVLIANELVSFTRGDWVSLGVDYSVATGSLNFKFNGAGVSTGSGITGGNELFNIYGQFANFNGNEGVGVVVNQDNYQFEAVPEPATMTILGLGALAALRRKKKA